MEHAMRLGFVVPAGNTTVESEIPPRIHAYGSAHFHRFVRLVTSDADVADCESAVVEAAQVLRAARLDAVALAYTAGSYYGGRDLDERLIARMSDAAGCRATTAAHAIVSALRELGAVRIGVVSPYSQEINERCRRYLSDAGFSVSSVVGSPPPGPAGDVPAQEIERMARAAVRDGPDALLISCTALRTMALIDGLEAALGRPVVSSNSATLWEAIGAAGPIDARAGSLLARAPTKRPAVGA